MQVVKKAVKSAIEREQRRILVVTLSYDDELVLKGDNVSLGYVENNDMAKEVLKAVLQFCRMKRKRMTPHTTLADTWYLTRAKIWTFRRCLQS